MDDGSNGLGCDELRITNLWEGLHREIRRQGTNVHEADDVAQEAWLRTLRHPPQRVDLLRHWLRIVGLRVLGEFRRSDRSRQDRERRVALGGAESSEKSAEESRVLRLVGELPSPYREAVTLRYVEGLEVNEIADRLGSSANTVRSWLKRGLGRLRVRLGEHEGPPPRKRARGLLVWLFGARPARTRAVASVGCALLIAGAWGFLRHEPDAAHGARVAVASMALPALAPSTMREPVPLVEVPPPKTLAPPAPQGPRYAGTVLQPDGTPVAGASVWSSDAGGKDARLEAVTDAFGNFAAEGIEKDRFLRATHPRWLPSRSSNFATGAAAASVELRLRSGRGELEVRCLQDGEPLAHAELELDWGYDHPAGVHLAASGEMQVERESVLAETDELGRARLPKPPRSEARLQVHASGRSNQRRVIPIVPGDSSLDLDLPHQALVSGTLFETGGAPVPRTKVELTRRSDPWVLTEFTDAAGRFAFALDAGPFELHAMLPRERGLASGSAAGSVETGERLTLDLVLDAADRVSGRALDAGGPLALALVTCTTHDEVEAERRTRQTYADHDGRFEFVGLLPDEEVTLKLFAADPAALCELDSVHVGDANVILCTNRPISPRSVELQFVCADPTSMPTLVDVRSAAGRIADTFRVDSASGWCPLQIPWSGPAFAFAWTPGTGSLAVQAGQLQGEGPRTIRVPVPGRVSFRLLMPDGRAPTDLVGGIQIDNFGLSWIADARGTQMYRDLCVDPETGTAEARLFPGSYRYFFRAPGLADASGVVNVDAETTVTEVVTLQPGIETTVEIAHAGEPHVPELALRTPAGWRELEGLPVQITSTEVCSRSHSRRTRSRSRVSSAGGAARDASRPVSSSRARASVWTST